MIGALWRESNPVVLESQRQLWKIYLQPTCNFVQPDHGGVLVHLYFLPLFNLPPPPIIISMLSGPTTPNVVVLPPFHPQLVSIL